MIPCVLAYLAVQGHLISSQLFVFCGFLFLFTHLNFQRKFGGFTLKKYLRAMKLKSANFCPAF